SSSQESSSSSIRRGSKVRRRPTGRTRASGISSLSRCSRSSPPGRTRTPGATSAALTLSSGAVRAGSYLAGITSRPAAPKESEMEPFDQAIQEHLDLQRRNASLEDTMPLDRYRVDEALDRHGLFKSEIEPRME